MKQTLAALACAAAMVASLAACDGASDKAALPSGTGGSSPSATAASQASATTPTSARPTGTAAGPLSLAARSTTAYGGLKLVVNQPKNMSSPSRPRMRLFFAFLQGVGRTKAQNRLDPSVSRLASASVVRSVQTLTDAGSVQAIGSVTFTVSKVQTGTTGIALISGCLDQSKVVQVRKDGSHYVAADVKKSPTRKMTAKINPGKPGPRVTAFTMAAGAC